MKIDSLSMANFRGFEQIDIGFERDLTVIAGVNGVGKSSVLHALSVLLSRALPEFTPSRARPRHFEDDDIHSDKISLDVEMELSIDGQSLDAGIQRVRDGDAESDWFILLRHVDTGGQPSDFKKAIRSRTLTGDLDAAARETRKALNALKQQPNQPLAVLFSPRRQLPGKPRSLPETKPFEVAQAYTAALMDREVELREFLHWFRVQKQLEGGSERRKDVLAALRSVVGQLVPEFSNLRLQEKPSLAFLVEKDGQDLQLHQLSDGERGLLALVFDLTRRLAIANPESDDPISEGVAVVMIDEIELHLHPKWQRQVLRRLTQTFQNCQFIVTTHSPQVIGEVEARGVRLLSIDQGKVVRETPGMAFGADSNWILRVLMDADEMDSDTQRKLDEIHALIAARELDLAQASVRKLRNRIGNTEAIQKAASTIQRVEFLGK